MSYSHNSQDLHIVPCLAPVDIAAATTASDVIDAGECQHVQFLMYFGTLDVAGVVNVYGATSPAGAGAAAITGWHYRWSAATGTDAMEAVAAGTLDLAVADTRDGRILVIDIDPAILPADLKGNPALLKKWRLHQESLAALRARGKIGGGGPTGIQVEVDLV